MKTKLLTATLLWFTPFILAGCAGVQITKQCRDGEIPGEKICEIIVQKPFESDPALDASLVSLDTSKSTAIINGAQVYVTISAKQGTTTIGSELFLFIRSGDSYFADDPTGIEMFVLQYGEDGVHFMAESVEFGVTASGSGTNTVTSELKYDGALIAGASYSWYYNGGSGPPQDPQ